MPMPSMSECFFRLALHGDGDFVGFFVAGPRIGKAGRCQCQIACRVQSLCFTKGVTQLMVQLYRPGNARGGCLIIAHQALQGRHTR